MPSSFVSVMPGADIPVPVLVLGGHFENDDFGYIRVLKIGIFLYFDFGFGLNRFKPRYLTGQKEV